MTQNLLNALGDLHKDQIKSLTSVELADYAIAKKWDRKFINDLPDAAFAVILPGGKKDQDGKTVPRRLRKLPHHNMNVKSPNDNGSVDLPHLSFI